VMIFSGKVTLVLLLSLLLQAAPAARGTVVSGQLLLRDGSPAVAVRISAITAPPPNIRPADGQNYYASQPPVSAALTDEKGRFRLMNVPTGRYYIVAGIVGHGTFHPGTTDIDAATIVTTTADAPLEGIDFRMTTAPGSRVRGRIVPAPFAGTQERAVLSGVTVGDLVDVPINTDGSFEFGRIPSGEYFLSLIAQPPGLPAKPFRVADQDVTSVELARPPTLPVYGRIVVQNGPLPRALLGFFTTQDYVAATINDDNTFSVRLHDARYRVDLGGMPVGYSVTSVGVGPEEVSGAGFAVPAAAKAGVVITVAVPANLPRITGRIAGTPAASARVVATGPIVGRLEAPVRPDGTFEFAAVPPGVYRLTVPQMPDLAPADVVVDYAAGADVRLSSPQR
jgi:hypothetical protein